MMEEKTGIEEARIINRSIIINSSSMMVIGFFGQIMAFVVSAMIAGFFGINWQTDLYFLSLGISAIFTNLVSGALRITVLPVFIEEQKNSGENNNTIEIIEFFLLLFSLCAILLIIGLSYSPIFSKIFVSKNEVFVRQIIILSSIMIPITLIRQYLTVVYASKQKFIIAELSTLVIQIIVTIFILSFHQNMGVFSIIWGQIVGTSIGLILVYCAIYYEFGWVPIPKWGVTEYTKKISQMIIIPLIAYSLLNLDVFSLKYVASLIREGAISTFDYAIKIAAIPGLLIGLGPFEVLYSYWTKMDINGDTDFFVKSLKKSFSMLITITVPMILIILILKLPIVQILLQRKEFSQVDSLNTARILGILVFGSIPAILFSLLIRVVYSKKDMNTLLWVSLSKGLLTPTLAFLLSIILKLNLDGIAYANVISWVLSTILLLLLVLKRNSYISTLLSKKFMVQISLAGGITFILGNSIFLLIGSSLLFSIIFIPIVIVCTYVFILMILKNKELESIFHQINNVVIYGNK